MATKPKAQPGGLAGRFPETLTLKDLITIISVAVTLTLAWGMFSTRLTILEKEIVTLQDADRAHNAALAKLGSQVRHLESNQQDNDLIIDQVYMILKKPTPIRRVQPDQ